MAYSQQTWTDNSTPVDSAHMTHIEQGIATADANATTGLGKANPPSYGTILPASPVDGQEHILVDSTTNPTYQWRFRYNAASTSTYKWGFIGGPAAGAEVLGSLTTGSPTYVDVGGPSLAVPRAGIYMVGLGGQINGAGALALNGAGITASDDVGVVNNSTFAITVWIQFRATLTAATAVVYGRQAGAAPTFLRTRFTLIPEKVS